MKILVCNAGSTSLKFQLFDMPEGHVLSKGKVERVGRKDAIYWYSNADRQVSLHEENLDIPDYTAGIRRYLDDLLSPEHGALSSLEELGAVGFKTVLAKDFYGVHLLTPEVLAGMQAYMCVAPAHNGPYLQAIENFRQLLPNHPLVGVFETAFHQTIPEERRIYSIPWEWTEKYGIRRMGYHGASHSYIAEQTGRTGRVISCHLGGSCSLCAILDGKSMDNSFGFSLQAGIPHSNRVGEMDSFIIKFLMDQGLSAEEVFTGLCKQGGLLGVSGVSNDLRQVMEAAEAGHARSQLAVDIFVTEIQRTIGMYFVELGGLDQLVFTAGIGENNSKIRAAVCSRLSALGVILDEKKNAENAPVISVASSPVTVRVIPANEELGVASKTYELLSVQN